MYKNFKWYLCRLKAMTVSEIFDRIKFTIRKHKWKKFGLTRSHLEFKLPKVKQPLIINNINELNKETTDELINCANRYLNHEWTIFERSIVEKEINWHFNPYQRKIAPKIFSFDIDYKQNSNIGDIKFIWEKNRHHHLTVLAAAYAITKDDSYAEEVKKQIFSWVDQNPVLIGVNWLSPLEVGIRLLSWVWCERLLRGSNAYDILFSKNSPIWMAIYQQMFFISKSFCSGSSANNHLIGEMACLYVSCQSFPLQKKCKKWIKLSKNILEKEIPRQTFSNGINRELAFGYQFFVLDFALISFLEGKFYQDEFSNNFVSNVKSMLNVIPDLTDIGGNFPRYGDSDNGKGLQLFADSFGREDWLFRLGKRYLNSNVPVKEGGQFAEIFYTSLIDGSSSFSCKLEYASNKSNLEFKDAGIYIMSNNRGRSDEVFVLADAGPLGFLSIAAHGHADALSFTMSISGNPIIVDPGTYAYNLEPEMRSLFRGTSSHNTLTINGCDQSKQGGPQMWTKKAVVTVNDWSLEKNEKRLIASHNGYLPNMHNRNFRMLENHLIIEDTIKANEKVDLVWSFHLHPSCKVLQSGNTVKIIRDMVKIEFVVDSICKVRVEKGKYSSSYSNIEDCEVLRCYYRGIPERNFKIRIGF